jgi:hypothetical protein
MGPSHRAIAASPFVFVVAALALVAAVPEAARADVRYAVVEVVKLAALAGSVAAALAYSPGDYLRRGWALNAACYVALLTRDAWLFVAPGPPSPLVEALRALLVAIANASGVASTWMLARAWHVAGLELPGSPITRRTAMALSIGASLLFAGPSLFYDVRDSLAGAPDRYWTIPSDLGDLLALPVLAPVALTALATRGGSLIWPWGLYTISLLAWLLYDAVLSVPDLLNVSHDGFRAVAEVFRFLAGACACAAGLAQRRAVHDVGD